MHKIGVFLLLILLSLSACSKNTENLVIETESFDLEKAQDLMELTWKPIHEMTNSELDTKPAKPLYSKEDFFTNYDFSYMTENMRNSIFDDIAKMNGNELVKDNEGRIQFGDDKYIHYIPTIYDDNIYIDKAYIETRIDTSGPVEDKTIVLMIEELIEPRWSSWFKFL